MQKVLFLHGALGSSSNFTPLIEKASPFFECHTFEFPGHGRSQPTYEFSIGAFSTALIEHVSGFDQSPHVFGYSMGGYIALHAASKSPGAFASVMTLATKFNWNEDEGKKQAAMLNADKMEEKVPRYAAYLQQQHHNWKQLVASTSSLISELSAHPPLTDEILSQLDLPVRVGLGDRDTMVTIDETGHVYRTLKKGSFYIIPGMEHPIEKLNTDLVLANMTDFFKP